MCTEKLPRDVTDIQCGPGTARHVRKALVCMEGQTSESNTAAQRLAASHAPQATTHLLHPGSGTGGSVTNGINQQQWALEADGERLGRLLEAFRELQPPEARGLTVLSPSAAKRRRRQQAGAGGGMGLARTRHKKTNGNNLDVWRALVARVPGRSLLGGLLHLRLPLSFGLQVPALPFLEATLLVLCLRLRPRKRVQRCSVSVV